MKHLFIFSICMVITVSSFSQLEKREVPKSVNIGKVKSGLLKMAELSYMVTDNDTAYILLYNDLKYKQITVWGDVFFSGGYTVLDGFYNILIEAVDADKGKELSFKLGSTNITTLTRKMMGVKYVTLLIEKPGGSIGEATLNKAQINKLFDKVQKEE